MPEPRLEICGYCETPTWCEQRSNGRWQCRACKAEHFIAALFRPLGFQLMAWQRTIVRDLYGTVDVDDGGLRRYRRAYVSISKKNGKSFLVGALPIYHLLMDHETKPEAYGAAASVSQASIVFRAAARLCRANPQVNKHLKIIDSTKRIVRRDGAGFYAVLSADGDIQDGIEPSLSIVDELHRWKTAKSATLLDVLQKGTISRREPLTVQITTAGEIYDSPLCYREHEYARMVLAGSIASSRYYPAIWQADPEKIKKEPDYWKSREARVAANPSHEENGGFLKDSALTEELNEAIVKPHARNSYLRYHLNIWVESEIRFLPPDAWEKCAGALRPLIGRSCYAGVDMSWTTDLTALSLIFPSPDGTYDWMPFFWMPEEQVSDRERQDRVPYARWIRDGFITATPGNAVDPNAVEKMIDWVRKEFDLKEVAYDSWNARGMIGNLIDKGVHCIEIPQNFKVLSEPTKRMLELVLDGKIRHANHPVLRWNADCATVKSDGKDNVQLAKPPRQQSSKRIDGVAAGVFALSRTLVEEKKPVPRIRFLTTK